MPYLDTALRQALNLPVSCPSEEDIAAAAAARGLVLANGRLEPIPAKPARKTNPKPAAE
jgi:sugar (pentulose or hexulose) kinase